MKINKLTLNKLVVIFIKTLVLCYLLPYLYSMGRFIFILLLVTKMFGQGNLPKITRYDNVPFSISDTVNKNAEGVLVQIIPTLTYYYNETDSFIVSPMCFIPYFRNQYHYGPIIEGLALCFPRNLGAKKAQLKIFSVDCELYPENKYSEFELSTIDSSYIEYDKTYGVTQINLKIQDWEEFNMYVPFCDTKEIELTINHKIFFPKQERITTNYFTKVSEFIESVSLQTDFINMSALYEKNKNQEK